VSLLEALLERSDGPCEGYDVVCTGHSLGAGVASILTLLLRRRWHASRFAAIRVRGFAFSPPGGLLSRPLADATKRFITSVIVGDDVIPRLSVSTLELLRDETLYMLAHTTASKADLLGSLCRERLSLSAPPLCRSALGRACWQVDWARAPEPPSELGALLLNMHANAAPPPDDSSVLWPPGRIVHLTRADDDDGTWRAAEIEKEPLQRIVLSKRMMQDHFPDCVLDAVQAARRAAHRARHQSGQ
jgi:sn1-specific diacylglycerol lipase